jgi:hypothetical protein
VVQANAAALAFAFTEASGDFAPYIGGGNLVVTPTVDYRQTGPAGTDFATNLHVGSKLTYTFAAILQPPVTTEMWVKVSSITPAANLRLFSTGNDTANGVEIYLTTAGHIRLAGPGQFDIDTGLLWPDTSWHLLQLASNTNQTLRTIGIDGIVRYQASPGTSNAPSPNVLTLGGSSGVTETQATLFAWPALYLYEMSPSNMRATFIAITNPAAALGGTVSGGGATSGSTLDLLNQILAAVRKTF